MIYVIAIEPIDTRYSAQWVKHVPDQIRNATGMEVEQIFGKPITNEPTTGAFLDFATTNQWKNDQASVISKKFSNGEILDGSYFLFMDAWNPTAFEIRYMADLFGVNIKIGGLFHAGSYDPYDFLGRKIKDKKWSFAFEVALYNLYDHNFFATIYHKNLFETTLGVSGKSFITGWPMEYLDDLIYDDKPKENLIVFPHRISSEKQPEIFRTLAKMLPQYEFVVCQDTKLTKDEYHNILARAKVVFSANLQETLGIGVVEGMMAGAIPLVPARLSYQEMFINKFKFIDDTDLNTISSRIIDMVENYNQYIRWSNANLKTIKERYFTGTEMYQIIKESING